MKKFLSIFLTFVVCFSVLTINVFAYSDYVSDDISENLNNFEVSSNYSKTFKIPGYNTLKALNIKPDQFDGYGRRYDCNLFYIYSNDLNVVNVQTGEQETISTNKYFYVLTLGSTSNDFWMWRNTDNDISDNGVNTTKKYNNISLINNVKGTKLISEDGQNWYYLDESLNTEVQKVGIEANSNFYSYNFRYVENLYYMFYVAPHIANNVDFGDAALSVDNYVQYYYNFNQTLYQLGADQRTVWVDDGGYQFKTPAINQNLIDYPSIYKFDYPNDDLTINLSVPYDVGYLNNIKSSSDELIDYDIPEVWWTSFGNLKTTNNETEIYDVKYLESITVSFYTGKLTNQKYCLSVYEWDESKQEIKHKKTVVLYGGAVLNPKTYYQAEINLKDKMSMKEGHVYALSIGYADNLYDGSSRDLIGYPIFVRCPKSFSQTGFHESDVNDLYGKGVSGYPDDPDSMITGTIDSVLPPKLPDNVVITDDYNYFDTGYDWLDRILNFTYNWFMTMKEIVIDYLNAIVDIFTSFSQSLVFVMTHIGETINLFQDFFNIFPQEIQSALFFIIQSAAWLIAIRFVFLVLSIFK